MHFKLRPFGFLFSVLAMVFIIFSNAIVVAGEVHHPVNHDAEEQWIKMMFQPTQKALNPRPDLLPQTNSGDWQTMIDAVWGPGRPASEQTLLFQNFITFVDGSYALFRNRDVDVVGLAEPYLTELQSGVSKGRFQGIMSKMGVALQNGHTSFLDIDIYNTTPEPGVPLLVGARYLNNAFFGACLTNGDSGIFAYEVVDNHPLGLEVGDVILGYDGRPWGELYHELLAAELPIGGGGWLTSDVSFEYGWDTAAGSNWHLFETIDIQKFSTGEIQHLPTSLMVNSGVDLNLICSDQINDEIPSPEAPQWVSWGVLERGASRIGFIRCDGWIDDVEAAWEEACLEMVNDPDLDGLIIDFRTNFGGNMHLSNAGLSHLFNTTVQTVGFGYRTNPHNHWFMLRGNDTNFYNVVGNPGNYFDKPIAVLLGPRVISSGDQVAYRMIFHPMVRTFGRPTSTSFDSPVALNLAGYDEFYSRVSFHDAGPALSPQSYLSYLGFPVDEEIWLDPVDCRNRVDTVIEAAVNWISPDLSPVLDDLASPCTGFTSVTPNPSNPRTVIKFQLDKAGPCRLDIFDVGGHLIKTQEWVNLDVGAHQYSWDGSLTSGRSAASGTYLIQLTAPDKVDGSRFTLVR